MRDVRNRQTECQTEARTGQGGPGKTIAYLLAAYPRWSETFLRQDLSLLLEIRQDIVPVCLGPGDTLPEPDWPSVQCLTPGKPSPPNSVWTTARSLSRFLPARLRTALALRAHARVAGRLEGFVHREQVGHIHAEFADVAALVAACVAQRVQITYSIGVHANDVYTCRYHPGTLFDRARFITTCNATAGLRLRQIRGTRCPPLEHIPHGVMLDDWPYLKTRSPVRDPAELLFVGRLVPKKGLRHLFRAMGAARTAGRAWHVTVCGDGPERVALEKAVSQEGLQGSVTWAGVVPRKRVRDAIGQADCLVVPSVVAPDGDRDGVPNIMLEAMATGIPVVGTGAGGIPEVLSAETGWVCAQGDGVSLHEAVSAALENTEASEKKRLNARTLLVTEFDARRLARIRSELFDRTLV